jgi:histidinol dehydrogenase
MIPVQRLREVSPEERRRVMERAHGSFEEIMPLVGGILDDVRSRGDAALREYTARFDGADLDDLRATDAEFEEARAAAPPELVQAIEQAIRNVSAFHRTHLAKEPAVEVQPGVRAWRAWRPIDRVGIYVPGGKAAYPSSVVMNVVPARIAGCPEIVICSPPGRNGRASPFVLLAAGMLGVRSVFKLGGAQAIAAMAYGTPTVPRSYKLFGAGNRYVTAAKLLASSRGLVAIDLPAGPTELLVIADDTASPAFVAADMIAQAEHAADSASILLTTSEDLARSVAAELDLRSRDLPTRQWVEGSLRSYGLLAVVDELQEAVDFCNEYAPEHLSIVTADNEAVLAGVRNAGSIFLGPYSAQPAGDYATGTNHVLPTGGFGRMFGPLSTESFGRKLQVQEVSREGLAGLRQAATTLAAHEGLPGHRAAVEARFEREEAGYGPVE